MQCAIKKTVHKTKLIKINKCNVHLYLPVGCFCFRFDNDLKLFAQCTSENNSQLISECPPSAHFDWTLKQYFTEIKQ